MDALESNVGNISHRVLRGPEDAVHDELELRSWELEEGVETEEVDGADEAEESQAVLGVLCKVLVDHVERALEHGVEHGGDLVRHQVLYPYKSSACSQERRRKGNSHIVE